MRASAVVVLLALPLALPACSKKTAEQATKAPPAPPVKVDLVTAVEAPSPELLTLTGILAADQRSEVTADTAGKVLSVMIERGQRVKMGDPVVRLDVRNAALSAREAQANLATARAQKNLAEEECKRAQSLLDKGAITRSEYDRQTTQCTSALQQVSAAQARAEMITKSVADGLVRAPFAGVVADRAVTPGEWVAPGRPLFTLVDDDPLKIELSVPEKAVRAIQNGQEVTLTAVANPCVNYRATITRVGAEIGRTRSLIVEATIDKSFRSRVDRPECKQAVIEGTPFELVPGMFAEATVTVGQKLHPVVPVDAVARRGKHMHAFVAVDGEIQDRIVQVGPSSVPSQVALLKGVTKGEQLVAKVTDQIVDGLRVEGGAKAAPAVEKAPPAPPVNPAPTTGSAGK